MFGSVLITGASRGLGYEFVKQLMGQAKLIFAACRLPKDAQQLNELAKLHSNIHVLQIDVTNEATIKSAFDEVKKIVGENGLNVLINNAGIIAREKSIFDVDHSVMANIFDVNVCGTALMCKHFLPLVKQAALVNKSESLAIKRAAFVQIGSGYGRITDNESVGIYAYKMSKAALVMLTKNLSNEVKGDNILCVTLEPGWVQTDMGGPTAAISPQESVASMLSVVLQLNESNSGQSWRYSGSQANY